MYITSDGTITERFAGSYLVRYPISIETMPLLHFYPRGKFLQVSTIRCNFSCTGCVSEVLTRATKKFGPALTKLTPDEIVDRAEAEHCLGIMFCLNEPAVSFGTFLDLAETAHSRGLLVGCSTNGYFTESALRRLLPFIDAVNIELNGRSDEEDQACGAEHAEPVFRNIRTLFMNGVHVEVAVMHMNGNEEEVLAACQEIAGISPAIPIQVMRFIPLGSADLSLEPSIHQSERFCDTIRNYSSFVYLFNSPGSPYLNTLCPHCGEPVITREMLGPMGARIIGLQPLGVCACGYHLPVTGSIASGSFLEEGMMGGYRPTRAFEIIQAILTCLDVTDDTACARVWLDFMQSNYINELHKKIQTIDSYYEIVTYLAGLTGREAKGAELIEHMQARAGFIQDHVSALPKPRVYYMMGTPFFALNEGRFETRLVEAAGGFSVNRDLPRMGKPGITVTPADLERMDPDIIVISGLFSSPPEEVMAFCREHGVCTRAADAGKIVSMPPSWDFGNPRWILGLMVLANALHPEVFQFDLDAEADTFYRKFYGMPFVDAQPNRSFFRPDPGAAGPNELI
ncbi:radical SAM protein [Methanosphaerula palustris]|nr:radical SAM protein [Methanosphaerula palustris]